MKYAILIFFLFASQAFGAIRYVDSTSPGGNDGLSWATAWDHPTQASVAPGDTVYISGGTTSKTYQFASAWDVPNGSSGNPVTFSYSNDSGHGGTVIFNGTGNAILTGLQWCTFNFYDGVDATPSDIVHKRLHFTGFPTGGAYVADSFTGSRGWKLLGVVFTSSRLMAYEAMQVEVGYCRFNPSKANKLTGGPGWIVGIGATGTGSGFGSNSIHHSRIDVLYRHGADANQDNGDDCIQNIGSCDTYNNEFVSNFTTDEFAGANHQDLIQTGWNYNRIYNNYFENSAQYCVFAEIYGSGTGWHIYNNVLNYIDPVIATQPSQGIAFGSRIGGSVTTDIVISNNTIRGAAAAIVLGNATNQGTGLASHIGFVTNNLTYTSGIIINNGGTSTNIQTFNSNVISPTSPNPFVDMAGKNFHLSGAGSGIINGVGVSMSTYFTTDKDGGSRGAAPWDVGAYEFAPSVGPGTINLSSATYSTPEGTNVVITATRVNGSVGAVGISYTTSSGSATEGTDFTDATGTFSWANADVAAKTATVTVAQDSDVEGNESFNFVISTPTGGASLGSTSSTQVTILDDEAPTIPLMSGLTFAANLGLIEAPFSAAGAVVSQTVDTSLTAGGLARYRVTIPTTGDYSLSMVMSCASTGNDSIGIAWDGEPVEPGSVFDVGATTGFQTKTVTWRGTGTPATPQFNPWFTMLTAGIHTLYIRGREPNAQFNSITVTAAATTDTTPPTPNPPVWELDPIAPVGVEGQTRVNMTASTVTDPSGPVEYMFDETSGNPGATDSAWQQSRNYEDSGLTPNTTYTYRVYARDALGNTTGPSASGPATTNPVPGGSTTIDTTNLIILSQNTSPFGVMTHFAQSDSLNVWPMIVDAGIDNIRDENYWDNIETTTPGTFVYPAKYTDYMAAAAANNVDPLMVLDWGNALYETSYGQFTAPYTPEGRDGYSAYALELLTKYPQIQAVEVWNEYNAGTFIQGPATADKPGFYKLMLQDVYETIKPAHPNVKVVAGATVPAAHGFFQSIFTEGAMPYLDAVSIHPYTTVESVALDVTELRELIKANNGGVSKPIWVTEWSRSTADDADRVESAIYAAQFAVTLLTVGVEKMFYYLMIDQGAFAYRGLVGVSPTFTPNPPWYTYKTVIDKLKHFTYVDRYSLSPGTYAYRFESFGVNRVAMWAAEPMTANINTTVPMKVTDIDGTETIMNPSGGVVVLPVTESIQYLDGTITSITENTNPLAAGSLSGYSKTQGENGWSYGYLTPPYNSANFTPMSWGIWQSDNYRWLGPATFNFISDLVMHPDSRWAIRRWTSTYAGTVTFEGTISLGAGGDGITARIIVDGSTVYNQAVSASQTINYSVPSITIAVGSKVDFCVDQGASNNTNDATSFTAKIIKS